MRIDIKTGGLDRFVSGMNSFLTDRDASSSGINSALQTISDRTGNLKGGVGALSEALGFISGRRLLEERRETAIRKVKEQTDNFTTTVIRADSQVAAMIKASNELFYQRHEWLRPPPPPTLRERWADGRNRFWGSVGETISNAWNGVVEWYQNTEWAQIAARVIIGAAFIAATILTGGLAAKIILPMVIIGVAAGGTFAALTDGCIWMGMATGFMGAGIGAFAAGVFVLGGAAKVVGSTLKMSIPMKTALGASAGGFSGGVNALLEGKCILRGATIGGLLGAGFGFAFGQLGKYFKRLLPKSQTADNSSSNHTRNTTQAAQPEPSAVQRVTEGALDFIKDLYKDATKSIIDWLFPERKANSY